MGSLDDAIRRLNEDVKEIRVNVVKTPVLTCIVTGRTRLTNRKYLEKKAEDCAGHTISEKVDNFQKHYVCKDAAKLLRQGLTIAEVRDQLGGTDDDIVDTPEYVDYLLKCNGSRVRGKRHVEQLNEPDVYGDY